MQPAEFKAIGDDLHVNQVVAPSERRFRTATGRYYYYVFNQLMEIVRGILVDNKFTTSHKELIRALKNHEDGQVQRAGQKLGILRGLRTHSDYKLADAFDANKETYARQLAGEFDAQYFAAVRAKVLKSQCPRFVDPHDV